MGQHVDGAAREALSLITTALRDNQHLTEVTWHRGLNALSESFNGLFKTELIRSHGLWNGPELSTLEYIAWFNHRRLHGQIGMLPPTELEAAPPSNRLSQHDRSQTTEPSLNPMSHIVT